MAFQPTVVVNGVLVPAAYRCDRCGLVKVGFMDAGNDAYIGFYHMQKTPSGNPAPTELAVFTRKVAMTHHRTPMRTVMTPQGPVQEPVLDTNGNPVIETFTDVRDEYTVCAHCMHTDLNFRTTFSLPPTALEHVVPSPIPGVTPPLPPQGQPNIP